MALLSGAPQNFELAVTFYLEVIKQHPEIAEAYYDLGELLWQKDWATNEHQVAALWQEALRLRPNWKQHYPQWTKILRTIGGALIAREDRLDEGKEILLQFIEAEEEIAFSHPLGRRGTRIFSSYNVPQHLGHSCLEPDLYLKMSRLGWLKPFNPLMLVPGGVANPRLLDYWGQHIEIVGSQPQSRDLQTLQPWLQYDTYYVRLPDGKAYPSIEAMPLVQVEWDKQGRAPVLSLFPEDHDRGWQKLKKWGLPQGAWFVGIHGRERGFHNDAAISPTGQYRDVDIDTYRLAIETIVAAGGWVVRMGDQSMKPLPALPNTIDYALSADKSDWMDIFLASQCRFFLGSQSGLMNLPSIFGRPCAITNWAKLSTLPCFGCDVFIMKKVWLTKEQRYITWDEFLLPPYSTGSDDRLFQMGVEMHSNTPEEVRDLVIEMLERTGNGASYTTEDETLQRRARAIFDSKYSTRSPCRAGRAYLRQHQRDLFARVS